MTEKVDYQQLNGIALAYMGDASYEVYIRRHLLSKGITKPTRLQHQATYFVSAKAQAGLLKMMLKAEMLTDEEQVFYKRGRNANSHTHAKNTNAVTYRISTGFEALIGYLALSNQTQRLEELVTWCIAKVEAGAVHGQK